MALFLIKNLLKFTPPSQKTGNIFVAIIKPKSYQFSVEDAVRFKSADIAAILHNLRFWLDKNKANDLTKKDPEDWEHIHEGRVWTYNSLDAFAALFPWLTRRKIETLLKKLADQGVIRKGNFNKKRYDRTVWYTINEPEYIIDQKPEKTPKTELQPTDTNISPNGEMHITKRGNAYHPTVTPIPDSKQHIKTTTTTSQPEKISFDEFALCLIATLKEMVSEGGWIPEGMKSPKPAWTKSKANSLYSKFKTPDPADCAVIVLNDWVKINSMSMATHSGATPQHGKDKVS